MARKLLIMAALLIAAALALVACGDNEGKTPLTIEQSDGELLTLEETPQRIASLSSHATDIFCAVGAGDQLVAVELFANCPLGSQEKPQLDAFQPNLEAIAGYQPDLVYIFANQDNIVEALRRIGIPVLYLELPSSLEGVLEQIELFGRLSGHPDEAEELVGSMRERVDAVKERLADVEQGPRIFHELDLLYFTVGPGSFVDELYRLLKAENIAADTGQPFPQLSAEVIIDRLPEVIILADEPAGVTVDSVKGRPGWNVIPAVQNDRICVIDADLVSRPGPRIVDGLEELAKCLYPERFP